MEEGIRKAEGADCASLLNVGAWSRPPPTEPVVCMNYSSICDKQLGNYYRDHLIKSDCENADGNKVFPEVLGTSSLFFNASGDIRCLSHSSCLPLSWTSSLPLFRVPPKDVHKRRAGCGGGSAAQPSLLSLCFAACSF